MFPLEQGAFEMLLIGAIALIVVGPKDLPMLMRKVGQFTAKMRGLAAEFRASFDEMARQSELDDLRREVEALRTGTASSLSYDEKHDTGFDPSSYGVQPSAPADVHLPALPPPADVSEAPAFAAGGSTLSSGDPSATSGDPATEEPGRLNLGGSVAHEPTAFSSDADPISPAPVRAARTRRKPSPSTLDSGLEATPSVAKKRRAAPVPAPPGGEGEG